VRKIIHVNQHNIKANSKKKAGLAVISVKTYKSNEYGNQAQIWHGDVLVAEVIYSPDKPLSCGAKVWIETDTTITTVTVS
jgi:hypothetical protein